MPLMVYYGGGFTGARAIVTRNCDVSKQDRNARRKSARFLAKFDTPRPSR